MSKLPEEIEVRIPANEEGKVEYQCPVCRQSFWDVPEVLFKQLKTTCPHCGREITPKPPKEIQKAIEKISKEAYEYVKSELEKMFKK